MIGFLNGVRAIVRGAAFLLARRRLWPHAVVPIVLTIVLYGLVLWTAIALAGHLSDALSSGDWGFLAFLKNVVRVIIPVLTAVVVAAFAFFTFTILGTAVASPFLDALSARTEAALRAAGSGEGGSLVKDTLRSVADAVRLVALQVGVMVLSLPLNLFPVVGTAAWILIGAWMAAFDFLDFPLVRHHFAWRQRWKFLRRHPGESLGFGLATFALLLVPFANLLVLPIAVVGATLLYLDLADEPARPRS